MSEQKRNYDVWFVQANQVYKGVPFQVVTDWVRQARLGADDMVKPSGAESWSRLGTLPLFQAYLPQVGAPQPDDAAGALEPIELDFNWKRRHEDEDDDVDMIPLIDISLVLLIFFMMTTTVAAISRIAVPTMENATKIETNPRVLRVDIDLIDGRPIFGLAKGTAAPTGVDADLSDVTALRLRLQDTLGSVSEPPEVRIAAHGDLPYSTVEAVMKVLDELRNARPPQISGYSIEVNEKVGR